MHLTFMIASNANAPAPCKVHDIVDRLNRIYDRLRLQNPRGYLDEFDSRIDEFLLEIAKDIGAKFSRHIDSVMFNFTHYPPEVVAKSKPRFPSEFRKRKEHAHPL